MIHTKNNVYFASTMTEIQSIDAIISYLTGLDSRITCNTTTAAQYADSSNTATFQFSIDGKYIIQLKRRSVNSSTTRTWDWSNIVNGITVGSAGINMWRYSILPTGQIDEPHSLIVDSCIGQEEILFWMQGDYQGARFNSGLVKDENSTDCYAGYSTGTSLLGGAFYRCSDCASGYTFPNMINFAAPAGHIAYSTLAPMACSGTLTLYAKDILSCSTVARGSSISLPSGVNYYAIETNHMIKLDI